MKAKLWFLVLSVLTAGSLQATDKQIDRTLQVQARGIVDIANVRGEVTVEAWPQAKVRVVGKLDDDTKDFIFKIDGEKTIVHVELKDRRFTRGTGSKLQIYVPVESILQVKGVSSDFDVKGVQGDIDIDVVSGDLRLEAVRANLRLNSVSGDIQVKGGAGDFSANTVSGDIHAHVSAVNISVETVSGDITVNTHRLKAFKAASVSGDIAHTLQLQDGGNIEVSTVSGDVALHFLATPQAQFEVNTGAGGDLQNHLSSDALAAGGRLKFKLGAATAHVAVETMSGSVLLNTR